MIEAKVASDVEQFGDGPARADDAERGQHQIPADERSPQLVARPVGHQLLAGEYDQHVNADIVETARPVSIEPNLGVRVLELVFEFENVRVIRHRHQVVHGSSSGGSSVRHVLG